MWCDCAPQWKRKEVWAIHPRIFYMSAKFLFKICWLRFSLQVAIWTEQVKDFNHSSVLECDGSIPETSIFCRVAFSDSPCSARALLTYQKSKQRSHRTIMFRHCFKTIKTKAEETSYNLCHKTCLKITVSPPMNLACFDMLWRSLMIFGDSAPGSPHRSMSAALKIRFISPRSWVKCLKCSSSAVKAKNLIANITCLEEWYSWLSVKMCKIPEELYRNRHPNICIESEMIRRIW